MAPIEERTVNATKKDAPHNHADSANSPVVATNCSHNPATDDAGYETYYPNIQNYLLGLQSDPCPLFKCIICLEELVIHVDVRSLKQHYKWGAGEVAEILKDMEQEDGVGSWSYDTAMRLNAAQERAEQRARETASRLPPLTGRETDNSRTLHCCRNVIGIRCLLQMAIGAMRDPTRVNEPLRCPFCRASIREFDLYMVKMEAESRGMCILCRRFFTGDPRQASCATWITKFESDSVDSSSQEASSCPRESYKLSCYSTKSDRTMQHEMCLVCLDEWILTCPRVGQEGRPFCPKCRNEISQKDAIAVHQRMAELGHCYCCQTQMKGGGEHEKKDHEPFTLSSCKHTFGFDCLLYLLDSRDPSDPEDKAACPLCNTDISQYDVAWIKTDAMIRAWARYKYKGKFCGLDSIQGYYYWAPDAVLALWALAQHMFLLVCQCMTPEFAVTAALYVIFAALIESSVWFNDFLDKCAQKIMPVLSEEEKERVGGATNYEQNGEHEDAGDNEGQDGIQEANGEGDKEDAGMSLVEGFFYYTVGFGELVSDLLYGPTAGPLVYRVG